MGRVGGDRSQREGVDRPGKAGEDEPPAPGAALWPCPGDSRGGPGTRRRSAGPLVFTHRDGRPLHDSQLRRLLRELGVAAVPHGFRSTFRDWAGEETDHPREVIEAALAHVVRNRVEAAYARSDLFERRRVLMEDWARYLDQGSGEDREP